MTSHLGSFPPSLFKQICLWSFSEVGLGPISNRIMKSISENYGWKLSLIYIYICIHTHISVQSLSHVWIFATPWTAACQASLSITNSRSLLKLMSIESVMPSNHLILCHPFLLLPSIFPSIRIFSNELVLCIRWPNIGVSASASVLLMNIQDWFPLGLTGWISLQSKGLSRIFSNTIVQKHQFFGAQLSL